MVLAKFRNCLLVSLIILAVSRTVFGIPCILHESFQSVLGSAMSVFVSSDHFALHLHGIPTLAWMRSHDMGAAAGTPQTWGKSAVYEIRCVALKSSKF